MSNNDSLQTPYEETRRIIQEAIKDDQLVLFVGAGVSINSGMPSWQEAIDLIGERLGFTKIDSTDFLKIPQYYYNSYGKQAYNSLMQEIFKYQVELPVSQIHRKLLKFNAKTIITTNYDDLIERTSEEKGEIRQVICQDYDIPYTKYNKQLIKMHGDFDHDNFVLKENDYLNYSNNFRLIENYVKAIVGSKVVLFVGYSFNDPDLKQIFNWIKSILGKDMRRAYLINADGIYNENEAVYYRNLGIEVIYASAWDRRKFIKNKPGQNLENVLDQLLLPIDTSDVVDSIYTSLKKYEGFKYIAVKYLNQSLSRYGIYISQDLILQSKQNNAKFEDILKRIFADKNMDNSCNKRKIDKIKKILNHSIIKGINLGKKTIKFTNSIENNKWQKYVFTFDSLELEKLKNKNEICIKKNDGELFLEQASIAYYLDEYLLSFNYLKRASRYLFRNKIYGLFFIAQINMKMLGKFIVDNQRRLNIDTLTVELIKSEINDININEMIENISDLKNKGPLVEDICQLNFSYSLFQKLYRLNIEASEEANTIYTLFAGMPAYEISRIEVQDFLNFEINNYLLFDRYQEIVDTYKLYVRTIISSVAAKDVTDTSDPLLPEGNVHSKYLSDIDIFLIIRYFSSTDIEKLFDEHKKDGFINLNDKGMDYLETVIPNIIRSNFKTDFYDDLYWRLIAVGGYLQLNKDIFQKLLAVMPEKITNHSLIINKSSIYKFLNNVRSQKLVNKQESDSLYKILQTIINLDGKIEVENSEKLIYLLNKILLDVNKAYDNTVIIQKSIRRGFDNLLMYLFDFSTKDTKKKIVNYFKDKRYDNELVEYEAKLDLAKYNILDFDIETENNIIKYLETENRQASAVHIRPNKIVILTHGLAILYIQNKICNYKSVLKIIDKYASPKDKWLIKFKDFDYKDFLVSWLTECDRAILKNISMNNKVRHEISNKLIQAYKENRLSPDLEWIYFNYFS